MKKSKTIGILAGLLAAAATYTGAAHAEGASAAALIGYGIATAAPEGVDHPAGFGLGVRGGYTLPMNVYLGGTFVYHLGQSVGDATFNMYYFGVEGGYELEAGPVIVRPYLGLGDVIGHFAVPQQCIPGLGCVGGGSDSRGFFSLWPGATVLYPIDNFFVGGDARFVIVTGDGSDLNALSIFATGGMKF